MKELKELQAEAILQNEPYPEAEPELRSQRQQLKVDPAYAGTLDKLVAEPSVRAVLDPPETRSHPREAGIFLRPACADSTSTLLRSVFLPKQGWL